MAEKILLVEDNEQNRTLMRQLLTHHGYEVLESVDGLTGLDMATVLMPDLILLDIQMPVMNGYAVIRALRIIWHLKNSKRLPLLPFAWTATGKGGWRLVSTHTLPSLSIHGNFQSG